MRKKLLISLMFSLVVIAFVGLYFRPLTLQTYVIHGSSQSRWITIEYGREECPALREILIWRELKIPESGNLCTSSRLEEGWTHDSFFLVEGDTKTKLDPERQIGAWGTTGASGHVIRTESFRVNHVIGQ